MSVTVTETLTAFPYFGGKSGKGRGTAAWILGLLPRVESGQTYCEPFAGMLGVLLAREPAPQEVVNDLDSCVAAFWRTLRDNPQELGELLTATEYGREVLAEAKHCRADSNSSDLRKAWALAVCVAQSISALGASNEASSTFSRTRQCSPPTPPSRVWRKAVERVLSPVMTQRLSHVLVECRDANEIIEFYGDNAANVLYLDPPYKIGRERKAYNADFDIVSLLETLRRVKARVLVSGYEEDGFAELGWRCERFTTVLVSVNGTGSRVEHAWMNYEKGGGTLF